MSSSSESSSSGAKLDSPQKRLAAVLAIMWFMSILLLAGLSYLEYGRANSARAEANRWSARYQEQVSKYCGHFIGDEKCAAGETAYEMLKNEAAWEGEHRDLSRYYLISAAALLIGIPLVLVLAIWVRHGKLRPSKE